MQLMDCLRVLNKCVDVGFSAGRFPVFEYWRVLVGACVHNTRPEAVSGGVLPSADWVLGYVGVMRWRQVQEDFRRMIAWTVKVARRQNWFNRPVWCAIDFHDDRYYGKRYFGVVGCQSKQGTNKCYRVATLDVCEAGRRFTLAVMPIFKGTKKADVLTYLVSEARKHVKIRRLLLDREFFSIGVFKALGSLKLKYIVCAKQTGKLLRTVKGKTRTRYTLENPEESFTVGLIAHRPDDKTLWVYATNLQSKPETIAYTYKRRWGIETGYRSKNKYSANTTTRNYKIRLFLILLAVVLFNLWVLTNLLADITTIRKLARKSEYSTKVTIFQFKQRLIRQMADNG